MMKKHRICKDRILPEELHNKIDAAVKKCYTCNRCTSGCPVATEMDYPPSKIIKLIALGKIDKLINSKAIWVCSSCQNCYSRCPFEINTPYIIDQLKEYTNKEKIARKERPTRVFHNLFLLNIKYFGRIHETSLIGSWKMFSGKWFSDLFLGAKMFLKGKLSMLPEKIEGTEEVKGMFK